MKPGTLLFRCNICGRDCLTALDALGREEPSCATCGSTPRSRSIIRALSLELLGQNLALPEFPTQKEIAGMGTTDWEGYASGLAERFNYTNTYFHQEPRFDIANETLPSDMIGSFDFVISSEVFEHVIPPVRRAFENVWRILRPGGLFILTAPYGLQPETIEHFPALHDFTLTGQGGSFSLRNVTKDGTVERFDRLVFHGGPGSTLEMRVFSERALLRHFGETGFEDITVHRIPDFGHGIWWPEPWSFPISGRKRGGSVWCTALESNQQPSD